MLRFKNLDLELEICHIICQNQELSINLKDPQNQDLTEFELKYVEIPELKPHEKSMSYCMESDQGTETADTSDSSSLVDKIESILDESDKLICP